MEAVEHFRARMAFSTDSHDVYDALVAGERVVVVDTRAAADYARGHVPGAVHLPHREMNAATTAGLPREMPIVVCCYHEGCNGALKGALRLAELGFHPKELLGGFAWWERDGYPVVTGMAPGELPPSGR
jgi:rhodanese-related sulfurtransferase